MANKIKGTGKDDKLSGSGKDDIIIGKAGDDILSGGAGNDVLKGGGGDDVLRGGSGNDVLKGGGGNDLMFGGDGDDFFKTGKGDDVVDGGDGIDIVKVGGNFADAVVSVSGDETTITTVKGTVVVKNVELVKFADQTVEIDKITGEDVGDTFTLTAGDDVATSSTAILNGSIASDFRFTGANETVQALSSTLGANDLLVDDVTTDNDVLNVNVTGAAAASIITNIETINATASANGSLEMDNITGVNAVNVSGGGSLTLNDLKAGSSQPVFATNNFANTLTVNVATLAGTTKLGTAEALNFQVMGATYGTTAATQSLINITSDDAGTLESLNIESAGTAANDFGFAKDANTTLGTVTVTGAADATIRVASATVSGATIDASAHTGDSTLLIDRDGAGVTTTNLTNVKGFDTYAFADATAGTNDALKATNIAAGAMVDVLTSFGLAGSDISVAGAAANTADSVTVTLDNSTAVTSTSLVDLNVQNVETLNIVSSGNSAATIATGNVVGTTGELTGDFTSVMLSGDTSITLKINVDAPVAPATTSTVVDASGLTGTAAASISAAGDGDAGNRYVITGSANADTITGGAGNDTINGGAGADTLIGSGGTDAITTGAGNDVLRYLLPTDGSDTVSDFTAGGTEDKFEFEDTGFGLADTTVTYQEGAAATIAANGDFLVLTDAAGFASAAAAAAVIAANGNITEADGFFVFLNNATGFAELVYSTDLGADGAETVIASFDNITTAAGVAAFDATDVSYF